jgi:hypothetical protein
MAKGRRRQDRQDPGPGSDNELAGNPLPHDLREALVPLVRLLARQAAREWVEETLDGAAMAVKEGELPEEE